MRRRDIKKEWLGAEGNQYVTARGVVRGARVFPQKLQDLVRWGAASGRGCELQKNNVKARISTKKNWKACKEICELAKGSKETGEHEKKGVTLQGKKVKDGGEKPRRYGISLKKMKGRIRSKLGSGKNRTRNSQRGRGKELGTDLVPQGFNVKTKRAQKKGCQTSSTFRRGGCRWEKNGNAHKGSIKERGDESNRRNRGKEKGTDQTRTSKR